MRLITALVNLLTKHDAVDGPLEAKEYAQSQTILLQQLIEAKDLRTRQLILDTMMGENLLRGADLSNTVLAEIHLEKANLEQAQLQHASLPKADLEGANLEAASLTEANLNQADLIQANLCNAELRRIHLEGAVLVEANLSGANLQHAILHGASLYDANLNNAQIDHADLRGCCMLYADLLGATFNGCVFDEHTVLPDGEHWTPQADVTRFTNALHPQFMSFKDLNTPLDNEKTA